MMVQDLGEHPRPVLAAVAAAERVLSRREGAGIVLADPEDLGGSERSVVARARVARNPFSFPRTLVVKHYVAPPDPGRPDPFPLRGGQLPAVHRAGRGHPAQPGAHRARPAGPAAD